MKILEKILSPNVAPELKGAKTAEKLGQLIDEKYLIIHSRFDAFNIDARGISKQAKPFIWVFSLDSNSQFVATKLDSNWKWTPSYILEAQTKTGREYSIQHIWDFYLKNKRDRAKCHLVETLHNGAELLKLWITACALREEIVCKFRYLDSTKDYENVNDSKWVSWGTTDYNYCSLKFTSGSGINYKVSWKDDIKTVCDTVDEVEDLGKLWDIYETDQNFRDNLEFISLKLVNIWETYVSLHNEFFEFEFKK